MNSNLSAQFGLVDGRRYTIGRTSSVPTEGYIYVNSISVSRQHAELIIKNGRVYLRDLDSTNGTYLVENNTVVAFEEGYVSPQQPLLIGDVSCTIQSLLTTNRAYSGVTEDDSELDNTTKPGSTLTANEDLDITSFKTPGKKT